jgi:hypothetical protein
VIEEYHQGLKQLCGIERCQARAPQGSTPFYRVGFARLFALGTL